jgi:hypothetical protein
MSCAYCGVDLADRPVYRVHNRRPRDTRAIVREYCSLEHLNRDTLGLKPGQPYPRGRPPKAARTPVQPPLL